MRPLIPRRLLLVGAGYTGSVVAAEYARQGRVDRLVGFLDDDQEKQATLVAGLPVLGPLSALEHWVDREQIDEVIITLPSASGRLLGDIVGACRRSNVAVNTMPGILEMLGEPVGFRQVRRVEMADLLRRSPVNCDEPPEGYLQGARVLITGAGGSIGSELARQVLRARLSSLYLLGRGENSIYDVFTQVGARAPACTVVPIIADIRDRDMLARVFDEHRPTVVFHAAAHKHVPLMEQHAAEAVTNNVIGTQHLLSVASTHDVDRLVFISTDKAVAPSSIMGATKRIGESLTRAAACETGRQYVTVRFGNVLGSRGSLVPVLERQMAAGGPISLTHPDMTRFFMTIPEAVFLVLRAGGLARPEALFVLDMGAPLRIVDLTREFLRLSGFNPAEVPMIFSGLRPGEKLSEALWESGSEIEPLAGTGVFLVREPDGDLTPTALEHAVAALALAARRGDVASIHRILAETVPTFASSLSPRSTHG